MRRRIFSVVVLLFIFYLIMSGAYLQHEETFDNAYLYGLIDLLITSIILTIIPTIWRIVNKKLFDYEKGKKICTFNSIGMLVLSIILMSFSILPSGIIGIFGTIIYYYINMNINVEKNPNAKYKNFKLSKE